ncbi:MAG: hypothetical protein WDZ85_01410 [Candidatus Paceibacterota bacterium]
MTDRWFSLKRDRAQQQVETKNSSYGIGKMAIQGVKSVNLPLTTPQWSVIVGWIIFNLAVFTMIPGSWTKIVLESTLWYLSIHLAVFAYAILWFPIGSDGNRGRKWLTFLLTLLILFGTLIFQVPSWMGEDPKEYWQMRKSAQLERMKYEESNTQQRIAVKERQIVIWAPPAPGWSEPMDNPRGVKRTLDSPRREFRVRINKNRTTISSDQNPVHTLRSDVLEFQSTSSVAEPITISW